MDNYITTSCISVLCDDHPVKIIYCFGFFDVNQTELLNKQHVNSLKFVYNSGLLKYFPVAFRWNNLLFQNVLIN